MGFQPRPYGVFYELLTLESEVAKEPGNDEKTEERELIMTVLNSNEKSVRPGKNRLCLRRNSP